MSLQTYRSSPSVRSRMNRNRCKWGSCPKHVDRLSYPPGNERESSFRLQERRFLGPGSAGTVGRRAAPWRETRRGYNARFSSFGHSGNEGARPCDSSPSLPNPSISRFLPLYPLPPLGYQCGTPASVIQRDKGMKTIFCSSPRMGRGTQEDEGK